MNPKALYDSGWQHPGVAFVAAFAFAVAYARRMGGLAGLAIVLLAEITADALFTGAYSPSAGSALNQPIAIAFVILGDLRFFLLVELALGTKLGPGSFVFSGLGPSRAWARATAWAFVVPVASVIPQKLFPSAFASLNAIFLVYEAMFVVLAVVLAVVWNRSRLGAVEPRVRRWILGLFAFELVQYGLWCLADVVILSGVGFGWLLRTIPNALYYAAFVPFAYFTAPRAPRVASEPLVAS